MDAPHMGPSLMPKQFVLCFDGTGNKFCGDESDSNVLKIYRVSRFQRSAPSKTLASRSGSSCRVLIMDIDA